MQKVIGRPEHLSDEEDDGSDISDEDDDEDEEDEVHIEGLNYFFEFIITESLTFQSIQLYIKKC